MTSKIITQQVQQAMQKHGVNPTINGNNPTFQPPESKLSSLQPIANKVIDSFKPVNYKPKLK